MSKDKKIITKKMAEESMKAAHKEMRKIYYNEDKIMEKFEKYLKDYRIECGGIARVMIGRFILKTLFRQKQDLIEKLEGMTVASSAEFKAGYLVAKKDAIKRIKQK